VEVLAEAQVDHTMQACIYSVLSPNTFTMSAK
jgi:hypothetical protein